MKTVQKIIIIITVLSAVFALSVNAIDVNQYITVGQDIIGKELIFKYELDTTFNRYTVFNKISR